jgi:alkylhydroperoxidase family enzyme
MLLGRKGRGRSGIIVCLFCTDSNRAYTIVKSMNHTKFDALDGYRAGGLFSEAEGAALDYVTELTREKKVSPAHFDRLAQHHSEREICEIVYLAASEHLFNMTNLGLNINSDMLCDMAKKRRYEQAEERADGL